MIDKLQISSMIKDIERYLSDLSEINVERVKDLEEKEHYYALSMIIFALMNRTIDIGNEIISGSGKMQLPDSYRETFDILAKNGILSSNLAAKLNNLVKYRNIIAHEYYRLSADEIFSLKQEVHSIEQFVSQVKKHLAKS